MACSGVGAGRFLNEQETNRNPPLYDPTAYNVSVSSNADAKTIHELYMWPFADAVKAGVASMMVSCPFG